MENKILVILGMPRSGTSLVTQWLYRCGLHTGDELVGPTNGNEEGHFEDRDFFEWHRTALREQQLPGSGFIQHPFKSLSQSQMSKLKNLIDHKNALRLQWAWKDPYTCLFLDFYRQIVPQAKYLIIWRSYKTVVSSLINRTFNLKAYEYGDKKRLSKFIWNKTTGRKLKKKLCREHCEEFLKLWVLYNESILDHIRQLSPGSYLVTGHASLPAVDRHIFGYISDEWGFNLKYYDIRKIYKERLLGKVLNIDKYIQNKSLLTTARQLQEKLSAVSNYNWTGKSIAAYQMF